jgi:hypothetical protein
MDRGIFSTIYAEPHRAFTREVSPRGEQFNGWHRVASTDIDFKEPGVIGVPRTRCGPKPEIGSWRPGSVSPGAGRSTFLRKMLTTVPQGWQNDDTRGRAHSGRPRPP